MTQLFFDNADFFEFRDYLAKLGVTVPIVAGVLPIMGAAQIKRFTALCGAKIPPKLLAKLETFGGDDAAATAFGVEYASEQCADLLRGGVPGLHFYTLNKAPSVTQIMRNLGLA